MLAAISAAGGFFYDVYYEILLVALCGFLAGGLDDLLVDIVWILRRIWRSAFVYSKTDKVTVETLARPNNPGKIAVFVAAWDESNVIAAMLCNLLTQFGEQKFHVFLGCYPNDPKTINAATSLASPNITIAINPAGGPTTKADCLNNVWRAMENHERDHHMTFKSILLHDAEDFVHADEPRIFDTLIERFDLVQIPVLPLPDKNSRWIAGHYCDEFAESHAKSLVVREAIGAAIPSAGVGSAISRAAIQRIASFRGGAPFDDDSLTEDYELGLRIKDNGGTTILARIYEYRGGPLVAVHAHFPATLDTAVRQKTRWILGIALAGWDRLGWSPDILENWMRFRDRRAPVAAVILCLGYLALFLTIVNFTIAYALAFKMPPLPPIIFTLLWVNYFLFIWRVVMRCAFVTSEYDWKEGLRSIPRIVVGNIIAIIAARRAVTQYAKIRAFKDLKWDKTEHQFPNQS